MSKSFSLVAGERQRLARENDSQRSRAVCARSAAPPGRLAARGKLVSGVEAIIFVGPQGTGKSAFYRARFFGTHIRINLDMLKTRNREKIILDACLAAQQPFVVDNTNPLPLDRSRYFVPARAAGFRVIAYYFVTPMSEALRRNNLRKGKQKIPVVAIASSFKRMQRPKPVEGYDEIHTVELTADNQFLVYPFSR